MKYQKHFKDINKRQYSKKTELIKRLTKIFSFSFNNNILKWVLVKNNYKFNYYQTQIQRLCVMSGRSKGIHNKFKISRILLRELSGKGYFFGLKKASW